MFVKILTLLGYINSTLSESNSSILLPAMSPKEEQLVILAWKTIRSKGTPDMDIAGIEDYVNYKSSLSQRKSIGNEDMHEVDAFSQYYLETPTE